MAKAFKSLKGQLLLDNGKLHGSFFQRSVILICQHDADGAFGLVLNRETGTTVGDAVSAPLTTQVKAMALFHGGPVQPQMLSFLHSDSFLPEANVMPNVNLGHSVDTLVEITEGYSPARQMKVFAGYAGWSPGQLEDEMKRDTWLTHTPTLDLIFTSSPAKLWSVVLSEKGWRYKLIAEAPEDLSWN